MTDTLMLKRFSGCIPEGYKRIIEQEPIGRISRPEEIASAVLGFVQMQLPLTGESMRVDRAQLAH
jgi:NAD(P)-dependent dehydrogenase (short-subunit alcohol dehydrogenase family)